MEPSTQSKLELTSVAEAVVELEKVNQVEPAINLPSKKCSLGYFRN